MTRPEIATKMSNFDARDLDVEIIFERFDPSVNEKFERCADSTWCNSEEKASVACHAVKFTKRRNSLPILCRKSKLVRKVARKLGHINAKLLKLKTLHRVNVTNLDEERPVNEQISQGNNTPVTSRPCSISTSMDQIEAPRGKNDAPAGENMCSMPYCLS